MSAATIEVKQTAPPKDGKKQGTVKSASGHVFFVWPEKLGLLQPGRRYAVEYSERDYKGRRLRTITKVEPVEVKAGEAPLQPEQPTSASTSEDAGAIQLVAAAVASQQVEFNPGALNKALRMAQSVLREFQRQSVA